ncbi:GDP-mannose-dependent alpha-(1-6)-phosphatidylinositol monomannoside mannosyltransferase [Cedecea lapagei]|uniref:GDP-mannose-dependent alpha-(1-6)-phosphatidylinositol monomannoside mannosyltransferase n=1 Tax=Cedecea lapagei TaxID=158823 RepID=A0A3S4ID27_9ENTR|nr:glycosyltransferase family 4 protein [Cedecea lapagei]VEB96367.1 GDP-mannose-dependent alpha-(1-6)-phosphatidylinositol monomannoside mannosyltransferase [Cedecea lapagei]
MKKIAHVLVLPKMAGSQKFCHMLLSKIEGYEKYVIVSGCEDVDKTQVDEFTAAFKAINVNIIWCKYLKRNIGFSDIKSFFELYKIFKMYDFDIVHTNSTKPGITARIAAFFAGVRLKIHTVHGISFYKGQSKLKRLIYWGIEAFALQFGDVNICVNNLYRKYYNFFPWKKTISIYNGYDFEVLQRFSESRQTTLPEKNNKPFSFLFVGRLDAQKDPHTLIKAFSLVQKKYPDVFLDIVGDGELRISSESLVSELKINNNVVFHGWVESPYKYFMDCNVFVCPSTYEAFGFIFLEAAFFKKPIVATNVEGIPEVVIDGQMGFLVDPKDHNSLASKMIELIESSDLVNRMGVYGYEYVIKKFNEEEFIRNYQKIYDEG